MGLYHFYEFVVVVLFQKYLESLPIELDIYMICLTIVLMLIDYKLEIMARARKDKRKKVKKMKKQQKREKRTNK